MEINRNRRHKGRLGRLACPLLAAVLSLGLAIAAAGPFVAANELDLSKDCSFNIAPGGPELLEDLSKANVVVDLYKVADAVASDGQDAYTFKFRPGYENLEESYKKNPDSEAWRRMAQTAAKFALKNEKTAFKTAQPVNKEIAVESGLYLCIARGADIEKYQTVVKNADGTEDIATIARSASQEYIFAPELIAVPSKQIIDSDGNVAGNTSSGEGEWIYGANVTLKPAKKSRAGSLEIVKNLTTYSVNDPARFIFRIEATMKVDGKDTSVYSNVVEMVFDGAGQKKMTIDSIPVGATVTVTEVYSGASYKLTSAPEQTVTISAKDVVSVEFTNDHDGTNHGGGGVNNHFTYDTQNGWQLEKQMSGSADGE